MKSPKAAQELRRLNRRKGQSIVEMLVGTVIILPITMFGIDLTAIVMANAANDGLAKTAARAAANQGSREDALEAAKESVRNFARSPIIQEIRLSEDLSYDRNNEVSVKTIMTVKLPAAFNGFETIRFEAQSVEPVVAAAADI